MIYEALEYLRIKLNAFITEGRAGAEPVLVLSNPWSSSEGSKNFNFLNALSLISIEEDKIFKTQQPLEVRPEQGKIIRRAPDIKLNLYMMVSAYNKNYEDALKLVSKVVSYFQVSNVFTNDPVQDRAANDLPKGIHKLVVELFTISFEQQNQIWASLSTGYLPSVIYKVRMLVVDTDTRGTEHPAVKQVEVEKAKMIT